MSVEFQEDNSRQVYEQAMRARNSGGAVSRLFISLGLAKTEEDTGKVGLIVSIIFILATIFVVFKYIV